MLSELQVKNLKPKETRYSVTDGEGLAVDVLPSGKKKWVLSYRIGGKQTRKTLGEYPAIGCKEARNLARELKKTASSATTRSSPILRDVITEWFGLNRPSWDSEKYANTVDYRLKYITEPFAGKPIDEVTRDDVIASTKKIVNKGTLETASRSLRLLTQVFNFAIASNYTEKNPCVLVANVIPPHKEVNLPSLDISQMPEFWRRVLASNVGDDLLSALKIVCYTAVRISELLQARWDTGEFDFEQSMWVIPASRLKMRKDLVVPLAPPVLEEFQALYARRIGDGYVFRHRTQYDQHCPSASVLAIIKRNGYGGQMVTHGFRSLFSTAANESNLWRWEAIEYQLAHVPQSKSKVRFVYNRAKYLDERVELMKWWAGIVETWVR